MEVVGDALGSWGQFANKQAWDEEQNHSRGDQTNILRAPPHSQPIGYIRDPLPNHFTIKSKMKQTSFENWREYAFPYCKGRGPKLRM